MLPCLLARTPRAGKHNHVDLVPPGVTLPTEFSHLISLATEHGLGSGKHYLASTQKVLQTSSGRTGHETLLLYGVDVAQLQRQGRLGQVQAGLEQLRAVLGELVTQQIDWTRNGPAPVSRRELADWLRQLEQQTGGQPLPASSPRRSTSWGVVALVVLLMLGFGATSFALLPPLFKRPSKDKQAQARKEKDKGPGKQDKDRVVDKEDKKERKSKEEQVLALLAQRWDLPVKETAELVEGLSKRVTPAVSVQEAATRLARDWQEGTPERFFFGMEAGKQAWLDRFRTSPRDALTEREPLEIRQELAGLAPLVADLLVAAEKCAQGKLEPARERNVPNKQDRKEIDSLVVPYLRSVGELASKERVARLREYSLKGSEKQPVLDPRDAMVAGDLVVVLERTGQLLGDLKLERKAAASYLEKLVTGLLNSQSQEQQEAVDRVRKSLTADKGLLVQLATKSYWQRWLNRSGK